ncbi:hypothetical protein T12_382 [Trichinella patagoniensis]|uniref:Uncharacterized protein n=1 Tax=Trichinella patagoniensis TaxID=990121 RepID=A0A0V0Z6V5_9BILA|nr:hypothetical protein T12_382 [Trichinella patagoniensis]
MTVPRFWDVECVVQLNASHFVAAWDFQVSRSGSHNFSRFVIRETQGDAPESKHHFELATNAKGNRGRFVRIAVLMGHLSVYSSLLWLTSRV